MTVKTTVVLDEELWDGLRRFVQTRYGTTRKLSEGIIEAVRVLDVPNLLATLGESLGLETSPYPSLNEVKRRRAAVAASAAHVVRELRDERQARLPRFK